MTKSYVSLFSLITAIALSLSTAAFAADTQQPNPKAAPHEHQMTKEQRQKMAEMHQKMADCLKSDKPMSECHAEMMKECQDKMGGEGCPMMGHHGEGHMHKHKGTSSESTSESTQTTQKSEKTE
jgi:hypothetical protein